MKESVSSAKIDKRAEICNILNNAFYCIAYIDALNLIQAKDFY